MFLKQDSTSKKMGEMYKDIIYSENYNPPFTNSSTSPNSTI